LIIDSLESSFDYQVLLVAGMTFCLSSARGSVSIDHGRPIAV